MPPPDPAEDHEPYEERTSPEYSEAAANSFEVRELSQGLREVTGTCPRCKAHVVMFDADEVARGGPSTVRVKAKGKAPAPATLDIVVFCTCNEPHPGRPEGRLGCGAYWTLRLRRTGQS